MKLPIKKKYFNDIKAGRKNVEYRDAHITFVCEETGETIRKDITKVKLGTGWKEVYPDVLDDNTSIIFMWD